MIHEKIAAEILEDWDMQVVILTTVDKNGELRCSASYARPELHSITSQIYRPIWECVKLVVGWGRDRTLH